MTLIIGRWICTNPAIWLSLKHHSGSCQEFFLAYISHCLHTSWCDMLSYSALEPSTISVTRSRGESLFFLNSMRMLQSLSFFEIQGAQHHMIISDSDDEARVLLADNDKPESLMVSNNWLCAWWPFWELGESLTDCFVANDEIIWEHLCGYCRAVAWVICIIARIKITLMVATRSVQVQSALNNFPVTVCNLSFSPL